MRYGTGQLGYQRQFPGERVIVPKLVLSLLPDVGGGEARYDGNVASMVSKQLEKPPLGLGVITMRTDGGGDR